MHCDGTGVPFIPDFPHDTPITLCGTLKSFALNAHSSRSDARLRSFELIPVLWYQFPLERID